ncbi:hypothetical protein B1A_14144, partial [mine drainage metagenome]
EKRVLFSEFSIIPREMIEEVGAWKNLKVSEDIDLYARISMNGPITHYPTEVMNNRRDGLIYHNLDLEKKPGFSRLTWKKKTSLIRDLILGCNYSFRDILSLNGYPFQKDWQKEDLFYYYQDISMPDCLEKGAMAIEETIILFLWKRCLSQ